MKTNKTITKLQIQRNGIAEKIRNLADKAPLTNEQEAEFLGLNRDYDIVCNQIDEELRKLRPRRKTIVRHGKTYETAMIDPDGPGMEKR